MIALLVAALAGVIQQPPAPAPTPASDNLVVASANNDVVTLRDVVIGWRLEGRLRADPDRGAEPTHEDHRRIAKDLVMDQLWLAHGKDSPLWEQVVDSKWIEDEGRSLYRSLWDDHSVPEDERAFMQKKAKVRVALQLALQTDPEFQRATQSSPRDVRRYYDAHPEIRRVPTRVTLGRVIHGRELHGAKTDELADQIRQRALEKSSLETAADELAPGSWSYLADTDVEKNDSMVDEVLQFARVGQVGDLSAPVKGRQSVMLFTVAARKEGRDVPFEESAPLIQKEIESFQTALRAQQYFVTKVLPEATYFPNDLFDDEIEQIAPGYKARRARAEAARGKKQQ